MSRVSAVIFDWAGTMVDFGSHAPVIAMERVFDRFGVPVTEAAVRRYMGYAKRDHVAALLAEAPVAAAWAARHGQPAATADIDALVMALEPEMAAQAALCSALIPGAATTVAWLAQQGIRIGSTTGYTRTMMIGIIPAAAAQGYSPDVIVCAGETARGRPAPFMIWQALEQLGLWPAHHAVVVDDAPVGIDAGVAAGAWTVGVAASGNGAGLTEAAYAALDKAGRAAAQAPVEAAFGASRADYVIGSVAALPPVIALIDARIARGERPGAGPTIVI